MVPPTPLLPSRLYIPPDQSLLLSTEPIWEQESEEEEEESFSVSHLELKAENWPLDPTDHGSPTMGGRELGEMLRSRKRARMESPVKRSYAKKAKLPSPVKDDFYARRVLDSDRRSSLGPKSPLLPPMELPLRRSISGSSSKSSLVSRPSPLSDTTSILPPADQSFARGPSPPASVASGSKHTVSASSSFPPVPSTALDPYTASRSRTPNHAPPPSASPPSLPHLPSPAPSSTSTFVPLRRTFSAESSTSAQSKRSIRHRVGEVMSGVGSLLKRSLSRHSLSRSTSESGSRGAPEVVVGPETGRVQETHKDDLKCTRSTWPDERGEDTGPEERDELYDGWIARLSEDEIIDFQTGQVLETEQESEDRQEKRGGSHMRSSEVTGADSEQVRHERPILTSRTTYDHVPPRCKVPLPLTRPGKPFGNATATRATQPTSRTNATTSRGPLQPVTQTAFTNRFLSLLPPPGKMSSTAQPIQLKATDRATDLAAKRERFEALSRAAEAERRKHMAAVSGSRPAKEKMGLKPTIPIRGGTPGKAGRQRAEARKKYEQEMREKREVTGRIGHVQKPAK